MSDQQKLPWDVIVRILCDLDPHDPMTKFTYHACGEAGGGLALAARRTNPLFQYVALRNDREIEAFYELSAAQKHRPISNDVHHLVMDCSYLYNCQAPIRHTQCNEIISRCSKTDIIDLTCINLRRPPLTVNFYTREIILEEVTFERGTTIVDFLARFDHVDTLSMRGVIYGRLTSSTDQLPQTLHSLCVHFLKPTYSTIGGNSDDFMAWMARNPEKIPDVEQLELMEIGDEHVGDVVLVLAYLKDVVNKVNLTMRKGETAAQEKILAYTLTNRFPIEVFRGASGEDKEEAFNAFVDM